MTNTQQQRPANKVENFRLINRLSHVQRCALRLALNHKRADEGGRDGCNSLRGRQTRMGCDVTVVEVLVEAFDCRPTLDPLRDREGNRTFGCQHFRRGDVKPSQRVTVSRAFRRLEERGLVTRMEGGYWSGADLTEQGEAVARQLADYQEGARP